MPYILQRVSEGKRDELLTKWQWHEFLEKKAPRRRLGKMMGPEQYVREMSEYFCQEREKKVFERRLKKKGKQEYRVSGS